MGSVRATLMPPSEMAMLCPSRSCSRRLRTVIGKLVQYLGNRRRSIFGFTATSPVPSQLGQGVSSSFFPRPRHFSQGVEPIGREPMPHLLEDVGAPPASAEKTLAPCPDGEKEPAPPDTCKQTSCHTAESAAGSPGYSVTS